MIFGSIRLLEGVDSQALAENLCDMLFGFLFEKPSCSRSVLRLFNLRPFLFDALRVQRETKKMADVQVHTQTGF